MATQYRGINKGQKCFNTSAGTSTTSSNVEISYDDTVFTDKASQLLLVQALEELIIYIRQNDFPS